MSAPQERLRVAEDFLQEAVYRSRARQAAGGVVFQTESGDDPGRCGLGAEAAIELNLSDQGAELFHRLWPEGLDGPSLERVRSTMASWIARQDALDRRRNHFLRDFRQANGADRTAYDPDQLAAYEAGLEEVNATVRRGLRQAAEVLLRPDQPIG